MPYFYGCGKHEVTDNNRLTCPVCEEEKKYEDSRGQRTIPGTAPRHTCIKDDGGTPNRKCHACEEEEKKSLDPRNEPERRRTSQTADHLMQQFGTGATRSDDSYKPDYEGFLSPLVLEAFAEYMQENRIQDDGRLRASDNWQRGIPFHKYMKSAFRHFMQLWKLHRGWSVEPERRAGKLVQPTIKSAICALLFNLMGYLHEYLKNTQEWEERVISEHEDGTVIRASDLRKSPPPLKDNVVELPVRESEAVKAFKRPNSGLWVGPDGKEEERIGF